MAPNDEGVFGVTSDSMRTISDEDLIPNAGRIKIKPGGKGIFYEFASTVGSHWGLEMTNFNQNTIITASLIFIVLIPKVITFGAIYGKVTNQQIGAVETILAQAWIGVVSPLVVGMPINIFGSTGTVITFISVLAKMSDGMNIPFLPFYAWISIWVFAYCFIFCLLDGTRIIKVATRFTDEIFALFIVAIFIMHAIGDPFSNIGILRYFMPDHPFHEQYQDDPDYSYINTALLSTIVGFGTTWCILTLRSVQLSSLFCNQTVRTLICNVAAISSVVVWTLVAKFVFPQIELEPLEIPNQFHPTYLCCDKTCTTSFPNDCPTQVEEWGARPWMTDLFNLNGKKWVIFIAAGPAILAFVLIFLDNCISWHLIYAPKNKLTHGEAYNYDLLLSATFNLVCGLTGLPWMVGTAVPSYLHLNALAERDRDGHIISVQETRLTYFLSHIAVGACLFALNILKLLPLPILYGVFLFMGLHRLQGVIFWERIQMLFMESRKYPKTPFTNYVDKYRIHMYTIFQLFFLFLTLIITNLPKIAIGFPLVIFVCIPCRIYIMPKYWKGWEICLLDGSDEEIEEWVEAKERSIVKRALGGRAYEIDDEIDEEIQEEINHMKDDKIDNQSDENYS